MHLHNKGRKVYIKAGVPSSSYLAEDDIKSRVAPLSNKINFSIMHLNARSLLKDLDQLNLMLGSLKKSFSVIGISETWLPFKGH